VKLRFADFTIDPGTRQLFRGDVEVRLSRKAFDLLALLVERRPAVVDKDTLREHLWGATTVVDANLNNLVSEIRTALDDDPQQAKFLRTVHRVGYAFCGAVSEDSGGVAGAVPKFWLVWNERTIVLTGRETTIGRDPENSVWMDVNGISRRHARIRIQGEGGDARALVEDLRSTNGTFVEGRPVTEPTLLNDGDVLTIGESTMTFRTWAASGAATKRIRQRRR
jgi:DNA-binding winged helix-turn-helix (wHTH) protein